MSTEATARLAAFNSFSRHAEAQLDDSAAVTIRGKLRSRSSPVSAIEEADQFVTELGFTPLGGAWFDLDLFDVSALRKIDPGLAFNKPDHPSEHLASMLQSDPVGHNIEWLPPEEAKAYAEEFYSYFNAGFVARLANRVGNGWNPITKSTIEAAYIAMDDEIIGLFLIEAED